MARIPARTGWLVALAAVGVLALAACGPRGPAAAPPLHDMPSAAATAAPVTVATTSVDIVNFAFTPAVITVKSGAAVTWTNKDADAHTVAIAGVPVSKPLQTGEAYVHTFSQPGTYSYICTIHPNMHGTVVVTRRD